jgi:hypothetical protein
MKIRNFIAVLIYLIGISYSLAYGQDSKFSALYILNFAKYVVWPAAPTGDFTITVLGDDPVFDQLKSLSADAKIGEQKITVNKSLFVDKIPDCQIIFISPDKSNLLASALTKFANKNTLIVTSKVGLAKEGASLNLITNEGKLGFEINVESLKKCNLSAKPALFKLGKTI